MKRFIQVGVVLLTLSFSGVLNANVLHFDDIYVDSTIHEEYLPTAYKGFNWDDGSQDFRVTNQNHLQSDWGNKLNFFDPLPPDQYKNAVFNAFGDSPLVISSSSLFNFNGAWFASWGEDGLIRDDFSSGSITVAGYRGTELIGTKFSTLSAEEFGWLDAQFLNVDTLVFAASANYRHWLMDNFTYNEAVITPEPLTATLLGISLLGLAGLRRRLS